VTNEYLNSALLDFLWSNELVPIFQQKILLKTIIIPLTEKVILDRIVANHTNNFFQRTLGSPCANGPGAVLSVSKLKKRSNISSWVRRKTGALFFPIAEPIFSLLDNRSAEVSSHFKQAIVGIEQGKSAIALLNLNMVLSLNPNHFLGHVYRGRIYIGDGRFNLASKDYLEANRISRYRFMQYDLYSEYFKSVNKEFNELGESIVRNFSQAFEALRQAQEKIKPEVEKQQATPEAEAPEEIPIIELESPITFEDFDMGEEEDGELQKFVDLGPITDGEIEKTDWDKLIKELTS
jgi:tetratricopeptide (TPR) repeat protein